MTSRHTVPTGMRVESVSETRAASDRKPSKPAAHPARLLALALFGGLLACNSDSPDLELQTITQDVIGGWLDDSPDLDHFGALVAIDPTSGVPFSFCTATLIGAETAVTAKHCAVMLPQFQKENFQVAWAAGPRADMPRELIPIASTETAPGDVGGFVGMGRDVAVVHLDRPSAIKPATPRPFSDAFIGTAMVSAGYGVHDVGGATDDRRRLGTETIAATEGRVMQHLVGSFDNFIEWHFTRQVTNDEFLRHFSPDDPEIVSLHRLFDAEVLYDKHEAVTRRAPTDTQSCFGDSGGPLAHFTRERGWETYGVVSGGVDSRRSVCDFGTVFSTFGPHSFAFVEATLDWVDPCGEVTASGRCQGDVAVTCETSFVGNIRRLVPNDCRSQGLPCVSAVAGTGCGWMPEPKLPEPLKPGAADQLLETVQSSSRPQFARDPAGED